MSLTILLLLFLSCGNSDNEKITPSNVNLTLTLGVIDSHSSVSGIVQISGNDIDEISAEKGVCYSVTNSNPTINDEIALISENNNIGSFTISLSGLTELTTYNIRPYLKVHDTTYYGRSQSFRTLGSSADYYPVGKNEQPPVYEGYTLVWADEFNLDGKPGNDWSYETGFVRNEELQWYQSDNATVKGGCLIIEGRKENVSNPNYVAGSADWKTNRVQAEYTSSCVTTQSSHTFMYGRFEIRAKIPVGQGAWPAIWLLGNTWEWPMNGEIDILEYYIKNGQPSILANACWSSNKRWTAIWDESVTPFTYFSGKDPDWSNQFHIWRMDWNKDCIRIYLDEELLNEIDLSQTTNQGFDNNYENPFNTQYEGFGDYILLNLAIGSNGGTPDNSIFPLRYYVDYVRVYQYDVLK
ncbi:glycoside hydrolase family 16 protein [Geofilum sp. OHC36d9]|uniref:glycoside hydrolase family 16 protein n=1 Tax=Geofilum sp. OHC36d9 TaxID=3458413 RepID=UPI004034BB70